VFAGDRDISISANRRRPVAPIVAAEESAGRAGSRGALKSLYSNFKQAAKMRGLGQNIPWHDSA